MKDSRETSRFSYHRRRLLQDPWGTLVIRFTEEDCIFGVPGNPFRAIGTLYFTAPNGQTIEIFPQDNFQGTFECIWNHDGDFCFSVKTDGFFFERFYSSEEEVEALRLLTKCYYDDTAALIYLDTFLGFPAITLKEPHIDGRSGNIPSLFQLIERMFFIKTEELNEKKTTH